MTVLEAEAPEQEKTRRLRWPAVITVALIVVLLGQMAFTMITTAVQQSATPDEPVYLGAAVVYQEQHRMEYNPEHPPLGKLIVGIGMAIGDVQLKGEAPRSQYQLGYRILYTSDNGAGRTLALARLPMIALTLLFGLVVFFFGRDLTGRWGGLLALALYSFTPDIIAHGSLATLDVPTAGFLLTSAWLLWRARERPRLYLPLAGLAAGAALAVKMSAIVAIPVVMLLAAWGVFRSFEKAAGLRTRLLAGLGAGFGVGVLVVATVWVTYLLVDPSLRFTGAVSRIPTFTGLGGMVIDLMPFPEAFRAGLRYQVGLEQRDYAGLLLGEHYTGSKWYYLPAALLIKEPLGALALWLAGTVAVFSVKRLRPVALYLLLPTLVLLVAAMQGDRDFGVRYAIFVPVFGAVVAAAVLAFRPRWTHVVAVVLVAFVAVSSLRTFPYYLPYSNEAFGGTAHTYQNLHDSNADWGQDMKRTAAWLKERYPGEKVWLLYHGGGQPSYYGMTAEDPRKVPVDQVKGLLVVSNSNLESTNAKVAELIRTSTKLGEIGHTTTIFRR